MSDPRARDNDTFEQDARGLPAGETPTGNGERGSPAPLRRGAPSPRIERQAATREDDEVVVITGASAGVGRAIVRELACPGRRLALLARGRDGLDGACRDAQARGAVARAWAVDVADADGVARCAEEIEAELGAPDVWINDAMVTVLSAVADLRPAEIHRVTDVNYHGAVHGTLAALRSMRRRGRGTIIQVGSALSYRAIPLQAAYCASKFALRAFTDALRTELMHEGSAIHVTMVHLPALNTPQFGWCRTRLRKHPQPVPPIFQPEVAARGVREAMRRRTREVWVGWPTVRTILGNGLAPWFADRVLARMGYESQQTEQPIASDRPDNLFEALPGDHGAHGAFDERARERSRYDTLRRGLLRLFGRKT